MLAIARLVHLAASWLFVAGVLVQGYLAGLGMGQLGGSGDFSPHVAIGYALGLVALAIPILALLGRLSRTQVGWSFLLLALYVVQTSLPYARAGSPAIAALHPANAMVLLIVAVVVASRSRRQTTVEPAP